MSRFICFLVCIYSAFQVTCSPQNITSGSPLVEESQQPLSSQARFLPQEILNGAINKAENYIDHYHYDPDYKCTVSGSSYEGETLQYRKVRDVAENLEELARYYTTASQDMKPTMRKMMLDAYYYLMTFLRSANGEIWVKSDYAKCYHGDDNDEDFYPFDGITNWTVIRALSFYSKVNDAHVITDHMTWLGRTFRDWVLSSYDEYVPAEPNRANANNRAIWLDVFSRLKEVAPTEVTIDNIVDIHKISYRYLELTKIWSRNDEKCGKPLGFGSWMHNDPPSSDGVWHDTDCDAPGAFDKLYYQGTGYHQMIVDGLVSYYRLLTSQNLCWEPDFTYLNGQRSVCNQMRYTLMSALSWLRDRMETASGSESIYACYDSFSCGDTDAPGFNADCCSEGSLKLGTGMGLRAIFEILSVVEDGTINHFPYYADYPPEDPSRSLTRDYLWTPLEDVVNNISNKDALHFIGAYLDYRTRM
ncbi:MAG: hypothetical protein QNJ97_22855 [Myxococcota bacterium]|nr:hypothetical protein [Myxococcota bacterium]